jgi:hypothetical protein
MSRFTTTPLFFIKLGTKVYFVFDGKVIKGTITSSMVKFSEDSLNYYSIVGTHEDSLNYNSIVGTDEDEYYEEIGEDMIFSSKTLAEDHIKGGMSKDDIKLENSMTILNVMHIPINQQVIINNVYDSTQGIIDNGSYVYIHGEDKLDVVYSVASIRNPNNSLYYYGFEKFSW